MAQVADTLAAGRAAIAEKRWLDARELLAAADASGALDPAGLELLAWSHVWTGDPAAALPYLERAYAGFVEAGEPRRAALVAIELSHHYGGVRMQYSVGSAWLAKAADLLASEAEGPEHGYLALERSLIALTRHDLDATLELAREATRLGREHDDRELELRGRQREGVALVERGDVEEGKAILDAVSVDAFATELGPHATLVLYCNAIGTCRDVAAYEDAAVLTEKASAFCDALSVSAYPGMCRVFRAEMKRVTGKLAEAEEEASRASEELRPWAPRIAAAALYEIGEVRLRLGDLAKAEEAFEAADDLGRDPEPGRSLLLLARGKARAAFASLRRALADDDLGLTDRGRLLPAFVEAALAAGETEAAREGASELAAVASRFDVYPTALRAAALQGEGAVELATGDPDAAVAPLRRALRIWQESGARYEAARTRVLLGEAYRAGGDEEGAMHELAKAGSIFDQLGARLDGERVDLLLGADRGTRVARTFLFTDIVDSTRHLEHLGDVQWQKLLRRHDEIVREHAARHGGEIVEHTGDGFFLAFPRPDDGAVAAREIQQAIDLQLPFEVRIGVHAAEASAIGDNYLGRGVHEAARIGAKATGGEILLSRATADGLGEGVRLGTPRTVELKGLADPVEVVPLDWSM